MRETVRPKMLVFCLLVLIWLGEATADNTTTAPANPSSEQTPVEPEEPPASLDRFPFLALVWFADKVYCAGTILSDRWVITMAQCCIDPGVSCLGFVMTGGNVYKKDFNFDQISATTYKVMSAIRYILSICCNREPMLLKTYNVIAFFEYVKPISVVDEIRMPLNGTIDCFMVGWKAKDADNGFVKESQMFTVKSMGNLTKDLQWKNSGNCLFTRSAEGRICEGQLGGPLVCDGTLAGVAAGRVNITKAIGMAGQCGDEHEIYVFLYTGYYARWIKWHANDLILRRNFLGISLDSGVPPTHRHSVVSICFASFIYFFKVPVSFLV